MSRKKVKRNITVLTGTRAEYGLLKSLMEAINQHPNLNLQLIVTGMHLVSEFGNTYKEIVKDGFKIDAKIKMYKSAEDVRDNLPSALSNGIEKIGKFLIKSNADFIVVLGDRLEALAGALAGLTAGVPIAHIHGGELAPAEFDNRIRFAISSLANVHFVSTKLSREILLRTGESSERIYIVGAISLDEIFKVKKQFTKETVQEIRTKFNLLIDKPILTVLYHPAGFGKEGEYKNMKTILRACNRYCGIIIGPNNDPGYSGIRKAIKEFLSNDKHKANWQYVENLPRKEYLKLIYSSDVLVGNSSSGIIEANALGTAVVNIGPRQMGRERNGNAIFDVDYSYTDIQNTISSLLSSHTKVSSYKHFGTGKSGKKIAEILSTLKVTRKLLVKSVFQNKFR